MVLHNNKWKNKASKKYYEKHNLSLNTNSQQIPVTKETAASSEVEDDNFDELPSNTWRYEEAPALVNEESLLDYVKMPAKAFALAEPDIILPQNELLKDRPEKGKIFYQNPESIAYLRHQAENEATLREIKRKYNSRVKARAIKGLNLDIEKPEYNIDDIDELLEKTNIIEQTIDNTISQQKCIHLKTIENKELEEFLDRLLE
ncbi:uncharacterized protein T551_02798 [Pneumocystis jirovecii RU7]|uniref:Uncharacterized protein n=1 Tax=Pneumocystis jirovecii (strain RU7) TaxID=1408657 RepID=A0A0W4ZHI2_PNEJ7|nr:uncharacterized protein T551_02798 [Pneumocystis jirovecii RU7]KTW27831.1 hypothetical protein T551_02798 [Pneumocystis jirovecii RU7]